MNQQSQKRPNFLLLFVDQFRYDAIASLGINGLKTPNLDRLVSEGRAFTNAYSPNPICVPARHCLLTSRTSAGHGYVDNACQSIADSGLPTFPRVLAENGYHTAAIGKCHFHPTREHHGYNELHLMEEIPAAIQDDQYLQFLKDHGHGEVRSIHGVRPVVYHEAQESLVPEELHGTNWVADRSIAWLDENCDRPFLLTCGWIAPHPPFNIPEDYQGMYRGIDLPEPAERSRPAPFDNTPSDWYGDNDSDEEKRAIREAYFTSVSMVDAAVGRVVAHLEKLGILDDTFIVFFSDHGEMLQDKGFYQKALPLDSAAKIPFVIRHPASFQQPEKDARLVDLLDLFPTMLDAAGIDLSYKPAYAKYSLQGGSLLPGSTAFPRDRSSLWMECLRGQRRWVALRDDRYKYAYFYDGAFEWLYDLQEDPQELNELVSAGRAPSAVLEKLRAECLKNEIEFGFPGSTENGQFKKLAKDPAVHAPDDWDSGAKMPFWIFAAGSFPHFGKMSPKRESETFLKELKESVAHYGEDFLPGLPIPEKAVNFLLESCESLGGSPEDFRAALKK